MMQRHAMQPSAICLYDGAETPEHYFGLTHDTPDHTDHLTGWVSICMQEA